MAGTERFVISVPKVADVAIPLELWVVLYTRHGGGFVAAGENAGRTLRDANGVTGLTRLGDWDGAARRYRIEPPRTGEGLAVLVQAADGTMLGAAAILGPDA